MLPSLVLAVLFINSIDGLPTPQQRGSESPVIFIDFNYEGKPGEKTLRSLDQLNYQDGVRARSSGLKDSYGNPVEYDTLESIDARNPSKNPANPNQFIIPGYASGILQPHELPTRSNFNGETSRSIDDDRIHFVDPLTNQFGNTDKIPQPPSPSLSLPGTDTGLSSSQTPINIPRPNIDLNETPQAPSINDPLNQQLNPPEYDTSSGVAPSTSLEVPSGNTQKFAVTQDLIPPQIPTGDGVFIPKPNLNIGETPIDNSNSPLNQGLLPPPDSSEQKFNNPQNSLFSNPPQNGGPIEITGDVLFAPKPSNGLLPPKDPIPNDISFQSTTETITNKFTGNFGGSSGVLGGIGNAVVNKVQDKFSGSFGEAAGVLGGGARQPATTQQTLTQGPVVTAYNKVQDKFTGSFGGSSGVLGGQPATTQTFTQIPVQVLQSPDPTPIAPAKDVVNKYQGNFGGPPGILVNNNQAQPLNSRFDGALDGASSGATQTTTTQTLSQLPNVNNNFAVSATAKDDSIQKYTGRFGGSPGVLQPFDNKN